MRARRKRRQCLLGLLAAIMLTGCAATTSLTLTPSPQAPVCQRSPQRVNAVVLWGIQWRVDQKDVADREVAARTGIERFFRESGCFAGAEVQRLTSSAPPEVQATAVVQPSQSDLILVVLVRELGPVLKLGSPGALVEGGTEVVLEVSAYEPGTTIPGRAFSVHWRNGGPGVVKGVASLPADIQSALQASLQPEPR